MSRQEDFIQAGIDYRMEHGKPMAIGGDNFADVANEMNRCKDFEAGAEHGYQYAQTHPNWISVEEKLPPRAENSFIFSDYVLVCDNIGYMDTTRYNFEKNRWDWLDNVTHWMPIVPPRKEE